MIMVTPFGHCPIERDDAPDDYPIRRRGDLRTDRRPAVPRSIRP